MIECVDIIIPRSGKPLLFPDENLKALGIKGDYINYFYNKYLRYKDGVEKAKAELKEEPNSVKSREDLGYCSANIDFIRGQLILLWTISEKRIKYPIKCRKSSLYYWMGGRPHLWDIPEIQEYKLYPNTSWKDSKSYLYYYKHSLYSKLKVLGMLCRQ